MANFAVVHTKSTAVTAREAEVPDASFGNGMNNAHSNMGTGIGTGDGARPDPAVDPSVGYNWTLLDQFEVARDPQNSQLIGGPGFVDREGDVDTTWDNSQPSYSEGGAASSGGTEGLTDVGVLNCVTMPTQAQKDAADENGDVSLDGNVGAIDGQALLQSYAVGWVSGTPTP